MTPLTHPRTGPHSRPDLRKMYKKYNNFALHSDYTYWFLVDAWVKKYKYLAIKKKSFVPHVTFLIS